MGVDYLLPGNAQYTIEKRGQLESAGPGSPVAAWQMTPGGRRPAYSVDEDLRPVRRSDWQHAVFLQGAQPVGLIAEELQLLAREDVRVEPLRPPGPAPTPAGHLFAGAWIRPGRAPVLVFEPRALADYLARLGGV